MKLNAFWKGLIMGLVGFIATTLSDLETMNFAYILISSIGFAVVYIGKNYALPSISAIGIDFRDIISGLILAVGMALSSAAAQVLTIGFEWNTLLIAVSGAVVGYITKTVSTNSKK